jgi:tetratricopeptide (TPR) repeat protein
MGAIALVAAALLFYWRDTSKKLQDVSEQRDVAQAERTEALGLQKDYMGQKLETWARYEISRLRAEANAIREETQRAAFAAELAARIQREIPAPARSGWERALTQLAEWEQVSSELDVRRQELETRLFELAYEIPIVQQPQVAAEAIELIAAFFHERGRDNARLLETLDSLTVGQPTETRLFVRAAAYAGQGRMFEALALHRQRAQLAPESPAPLLDAARTWRRMALGELAGGSTNQRGEQLGQALLLLSRAIELAVAADDRPALQRSLVERARCRLELGDPATAIADLDQVLTRDPADFEAFSTRLDCLRVQEKRNAPTGVPSAAISQASVPIPAPISEDLPESDSEAPALSIERLLPGRAELTESLQGAGRDLQSIYRGLHQLLRDPEAGTTPPPAPETAGAPPAGNPQPDGSKPNGG